MGPQVPETTYVCNGVAIDDSVPTMILGLLYAVIRSLLDLLILANDERGRAPSRGSPVSFNKSGRQESPPADHAGQGRREESEGIYREVCRCMPCVA